MDLKQLANAAEQIAAEKGIPAEKVLGAIEASIAAAYKKEYRKRSEIIRAKFNMKSGEVDFSQVKTVVDPSQVRVVSETEEEEMNPTASEEKDELPRYNPDRHIFLDEAKKIKSDAKADEEIEFPLEAHADFGRIAAQTAKQVILQNLREAERSSIKEEFADKEGTIVSGAVQRFDHGNVFVNLGRAVGIMYPNESIPGEHYRLGDRMRFYVLAVQDDARRPGIILSRSHPNFVAKLFELEVPEIAEKTVEIKEIAREAGSRTKIAVASKEEGVDPVGSAVGQRGTRVMAVTNELGNEKIDIIEWSDDPSKFIGNSVSPAKAKLVEILDRREARVLVSEDQLSLAIGKGGQNVRLAAKLTGWKIDVRSQSNPEAVLEGGVASAEEGEGGDAITDFGDGAETVKETKLD
ncbi:MAG: transcription termination factor NusA [Minisyncoccia bacterium]|jgi:N utilization substance protein A